MEFTFQTTQNESGRVKAMESYGIFGTDAETGYDDLADLAAKISGAPISMINIIGDESVWIKARHGIPPELNNVPRGAVCCSQTVCQSDLLVVPDTAADERFSKLPYISTDPHVRFYAGMPLIDSGGYALGTLCIMGLEPRELPFEVAEAIRSLARQAVAQLELRLKLSELQRTEDALRSEKQKADALILNILPAKIAEELSNTGRVEPRHHPSSTIMFSDFVGFTKIAEQLSPRALVDDLDAYFSGFDDIVRRHRLEKLKTVGDAYMCAGGLLSTDKHHAVNACLAALEMQQFMIRANEKRALLKLPPWQLRIGVHTGSVMSGVVGKSKFTFDIWGDAVNVAARMESASEPGRITVSESTYQHAKNIFQFEPRGSTDVKHKGPTPTYFLDRLKPEYSSDDSGFRQNETLDNELSGNRKAWVFPE